MRLDAERGVLLALARRSQLLLPSLGSPGDFVATFCLPWRSPDLWASPSPPAKRAGGGAEGAAWGLGIAPRSAG